MVAAQFNFMLALAIARLLKVEGMLSRTESIDGFHLKVSRTERGCRTERGLYEQLKLDRFMNFFASKCRSKLFLQLSPHFDDA